MIFQGTEKTMILKDEKKHHGAQCHRNNSFRKSDLCEKSGTILLVLVDLPAGKPAVRREIKKILYRSHR